MAGVNNVSFAGAAENHSAVKHNKGKKIGTALGLGAGVGISGRLAYLEKDTIQKSFKDIMAVSKNNTLSKTYPVKLPKNLVTGELKVTLPKKLIAGAISAAPVAGKAVAAIAGCLAVGKIAGAVADKIAAHKDKH